MYRVRIDKNACKGIFACLVRDSRFVEAEDGLAGFETGTAEAYREDDGAVVAAFDDDRIEQARQAADACPPDAISVEQVEGTDDPLGEGRACR
jgi:ferredoxin